MIIQLSDVYIPKELLHREKQLNEIRNVFLNFKKFKCGTNLAIFGVTGSGKTTLVKKVIEEEDNSIYLTCSETITTHKTIKSIFNLRCQTHEEVLRLTIKKLKENPKIIIIDEIDKIKDINNLFNDLNTIYRNTMLPIIIITLKRNILKSMPVDARKTLFFERLRLPSYNANELRDILDSRLEQIEMELPPFEEGVRNYLSAISASNGSARTLIYMTLKCIQKGNFNQEFIDEVYKEMMKEDWFQFMDDLSETEKEFLKSLLDYCDWENETYSEVLQKKLGFSQSRVSQILNVFEKYAIIETHHKNMGRYGGRKRIIKFASEEIYNQLEGRI